MTPAVGAPTKPSTDERPALTEERPSVARGIIVKTKTDEASEKVVDAVGEAVEENIDGSVEVADTAPVVDEMTTILFDEQVDADEASDVAEQVATRDDVEWAMPDALHSIRGASPVTPDDNLFAAQRHLWDAKYAYRDGGYSNRAPDLWRASRGDGTTVAVLDTGILADHPELSNQLVDGYDMISQDPVDFPGSSNNFYNAADGNGRDADESDPGDWTLANRCGEDEPGFNSSWHGTLVAGTVAAEADNGRWVAGTAPKTKILPVRVLGRCGGFDSDILAGITWASGGDVPGVPQNTNPADVINLSLGAYAETSTDLQNACRAYERVATQAQERGAIVVSAAGNDGMDLDESGYHTYPGECVGYINVGATSLKGFSASYSNYGAKVDITAPGGDTTVEGVSDSVLSVGNSGTRAPSSGSNTYLRFEGTSAAAPQVAAGAALMKSALAEQGIDVTSAQLTDLVVNSTTPYRAKVSSYSSKAVVIDGERYELELNCKGGGYYCGRGYFELSNVSVPFGEPKISGLGPDGVPLVGETLRATPGEWTGQASTFSYAWTTDDGTTVCTAATCDVGEELEGKTLKVTVRPSGTKPVEQRLAGLGVKNTSQETEAAVVPNTADFVGGETNGSATTYPSVTYGNSVSMQVQTSLSEPGSTVELRRVSDDRVVGSATLAADPDAAGKTTASVEVAPKFLTVGSNEFRAVFGGAGGQPGGSSGDATGEVVVTKQTPAATTRIATKVSSTSKPSVVVKLANPDGDVILPTGHVTVTAKTKGGTARTVKGYIYASNKGEKRLYLPRLAKGTNYVWFTYAGDSRYTTARSKMVTTVVR